MKSYQVYQVCLFVWKLYLLQELSILFSFVNLNNYYIYAENLRIYNQFANHIYLAFRTIEIQL